MNCDVRCVERFSVPRLQTAAHVSHIPDSVTVLTVQSHVWTSLAHMPCLVTSISGFVAQHTKTFVTSPQTIGSWAWHCCTRQLHVQEA